jgi:hypothetical protein
MREVQQCFFQTQVTDFVDTFLAIEQLTSVTSPNRDGSQSVCPAYYSISPRFSL